MKDALAIKQVELNVMAGLACYGLPRPLILANQSDRLTLVRSSEFIAKIEELTARNLFETWNFVRNHGLSAIRGWRERVARCSMQIIEHQVTIEVDFDLFNPGMGALPAVGHFAEILWPGKTDPFRIMAGLRRRGIPVEDAREISWEKES